MLRAGRFEILARLVIFDPSRRSMNVVYVAESTHPFCDIVYCFAAFLLDLSVSVIDRISISKI